MPKETLLKLAVLFSLFVALFATPASAQAPTFDVPPESEWGTAITKDDFDAAMRLTERLPLGAGKLPENQRKLVVIHAFQAVDKEGALSVGRLDTAKVLIIWSFFESGWQTDAAGDCDIDPETKKKDLATCRSLGVMQVNRHFLGVHTAEKVLSDPVLGFRAGLAILHKVLAECGGGLERGLGKYATGKMCGGAQVKTRYRLGFLAEKS